jgi:hypothetical protein
VKTQAISVNTSKIADLLDGRAHGRLKDSISKGVRDSLAVLQRVHKTEVIGRGIGPWGGVWSTRTGEATRSFHIAWERGDLEGAYGSELRRMGVLEMGTQEALGGPLRPKKGKYLAIPTQMAKVGKGRALWPSQRTDLVFIQSLKGQPLLVRPRAGKNGGFDVMYILRRQVTIKPHPTLPRALERSQGRMDQIMLNSASNWMRS